MLSKKMLVSGLLGVVLLLASTARAQDFVRNEVSVQGTGLFLPRIHNKTEHCNILQTRAASWRTTAFTSTVGSPLRPAMAISETRSRISLRAESLASRPTCIRQPEPWLSIFLSP
jgi:hypothetical protein